MLTVLKVLAVFIVAWIATVWPGAWTPLLMLLALSTMCIGLALERHYDKIARDARAKPVGA